MSTTVILARQGPRWIRFSTEVIPVGRVFIETKQRPLYLVDSFKPAHRTDVADTLLTKYNPRNINNMILAKTITEFVQAK